MSTRAVEIETNEVQGIILRGYERLPEAVYVLIGIEDPISARRWLRALAPHVTRGSVRSEQLPSHTLQIAFTYAGLERLGLPDDALATFSREFQEGMAAPHRQRLLGDAGPGVAERWDWGGPKREMVHVLLMIYAATDAVLGWELARQREQWVEHSLHAIRVLGTETVRERKEHFGFHDGIAQPMIAGLLRSENEPEGNVTAAGEFIFGYPNEYGQIPNAPTIAAWQDRTRRLPRTSLPSRHDFGRNGSYLVFRQLSQDVRGFWKSMADRTRHADGTPNPDRYVWLASKIVGRWPNGAPLALYPDRQPENYSGDDADRFLYHDQDPHGEHCPIGAHIRRSNPRDALAPHPEESLTVARRHRILRRGRLYGRPVAPSMRPEDILEADDDNFDRGLHFICFNTDIARQFEFVQHTWINNPKFEGLYSEPDPLVAQRADPQLSETRSESAATFTIQAHPVRHRERNLEPFVRMKGGEYFFLPGLRALQYLGSLP
ncbi:MAG: peroxidase [Gemmatimonas sp.]|nr:peroxidase [Gemmatimonas sp.]